ncbi:MAG: UDP-N-acetylmuramate dehydrogenase [Clostridia bacterium]|nr:UDP-N-acetylmuramate dehydrogenase [Clostridia bacterium]
MNFKELIENNLKLTSSKIYFDEPMKKHTTFKIGGCADCLIKVDNIEDLHSIVDFTNKNNIPLTIMGNGSNVLVLDSGIRGIVVKINIQKLEINENKVTVGAGNKNIEIAQELLKHELKGFEEISGIPGTIGGAIRMNAGAHGKEIKDLVKTVTVMDSNGNIKQMSKNELQFEYRNSIIAKEKLIVLEVVLELQKGNKEEIQSKMKEYATWRKEKQPLEYPNAGSTFKRGENFITAQLIDECGLKGYKIGGAEISTKHAGFIVNTGNATAKDVIELTNYIKEKVYEKFQKKIQLEIEILGE